MSNPATPMRLEPGQKQERRLAAKETHPYIVRLQAGEYVQIVAEQRGVDLELRLVAPDGEVIAEVDSPSPSGTKGFERVSEVAAVTGDYRVEVIGLTESPAGAYGIHTEAPRPATAADRLRVQGERAFLKGEDLRRSRKRAEAIAEYEKALGLWRQAGDSLLQQGTALYRIGRMREGLGERQKAVDLCAQAADLFRQAGETIGLGEALTCQGRVLYQLDRILESRPPLEEAVRLFREAGSPEGEAAALNGLGNIYVSEGSFERASDAYTRVLALRRELKDLPGEVIAELNLGDLYLQQGRLDFARQRFEDALRSAEAIGEKSRTGEALDLLARVAYREERLPEAQERCERALALFRELDSKWDQALVLNTLGLVLLKAGDPEGAKARHEEARTLFRNTEDAQGEAMATTLLGRVALSRGDGRQALELGRQALAQFQKLDNRRGITLAHYGIAQAYRQLGKPEEALREIEVSVKLAESQRADTDSLETRAFFFATRQHYFELYIDTLLELDRVDRQRGFARRALEAEERRRSRSLLDALAESRLAGRTEVDKALLLREDEIRRQLQQARRPAEIDDLLAQLDRVRTEIRKSSSRLAKLEPPEPLGLEQIRKRLLEDNRTLLLIYSLGEESSVLWAVTRSSLVAHPLPRREEIEAAARSAHKVLSRRLQPGSVLRQTALDDLAALILKPVQDDLPSYRRLLIVADGALQTVPFAALPDPGAAPTGGRQPYLVEGHTLIHLPSASVGATLRRPRDMGPLDRPNPLIAVLADPVFEATDPRVGRSGEAPQEEPPPAEGPLSRSLGDLNLTRLGRLPESRREAEAIARLWPEEVRTVLDFEVRRETLDTPEWREAAVLHFATHSLFNERRPELSGLVFSQVNRDGTRRRDAFLPLHEIPRLDLKADLIVLSACETGAGKELRGEGALGLMRGFMALGVPQLIASLWKVEDPATAELMSRFYGQLHNGAPPPEALRRAQISMLRETQWSDPSLWAGFVFLGYFERKQGGGIEVSDMGGADTRRKADDGGMPGRPRPKPIPPKPQPSPPNSLPEDYQFSSYSPVECAPEAWSTLLAYCGRETAASSVLADSQRRLAVEPSSYTQTHAGLVSPLLSGSQVVVVPELAGCRFNPPQSNFLLLEDWHCAEFRFQPLPHLPGFLPESDLFGRISFYVRSLLVADIPFRVRLTLSPRAVQGRGMIRQNNSKPYQSVFISYSHSDAAVVEVLERAYSALGLTLLRDIHFLRPGEKWLPALLEKIDAADIFQLFWSARAQKSKWVRAEWQHALALDRPSFIRPVYWEAPMPKPPRGLAELHFHHLRLGE